MIVPRFDEKSVRRARPAVPFRRDRGRRGAPSTPILLALGAIVLGVVAGILGMSVYQSRRAKSQTAATDEATKTPPQTMTGETQSAAPAGDAPVTDAADFVASGIEASGDEQAVLRAALDEWIAATNARDIQRQMEFYNPQLDAYYLARNASARDVRAEKVRVFNRASLINVQADDPEIHLDPDGRTATMRFRKRYQVEDRRGEVVQELRWLKTEEGWKIVSERDLRVLD